VVIGLYVGHERGAGAAAESESLAMTDELDETIRTNAVGPKSVSGDSGSVQQHSIPDQIAADRYLASKKASRAKGLGVRMTKVVPPGAV